MFFVVNPKAGRGAGARAFAQVRPLLSADDAFAFTTCVGDGERIAAEAAAAGHPIVVAVGGDGTINEVVNGLAGEGFQPVLGILPAGGANDLAHSLGLPERPQEALALLRRKHTRRIDLGLVDFADGRRRYYVNMLGMAVSGRIAAMTRDHKRGGSLTYLLPFLRLMFGAQPLRFQVSMGDRVLVASATIAHLANGRREGRFFPIAPHARLDDGLLELFAAGDVPRVQRPLYALRGLLGRVHPNRYVTRASVPYVTVRALDPLPCHMDGEPFALAPEESMDVRSDPQGLTVIAPFSTSGRYTPGVPSTPGRPRRWIGQR